MRFINNKTKASKKIILFFLLVFLLPSSGCWDKIEIDERAFVLAIGVDMANPSGSGGGSGGSSNGSGNNNEMLMDSEKLSGEELSGQVEKNKYIKAMFFMPIPSKLLSGNVDAFTYEIGEGRDVMSIVQALGMGFSRKMFFGQTKLIIIGKELAKNETAFREFVDYIEREPDMGRGAIVTLVDGDLDSLKTIKPKFEKVFASNIIGNFENATMLTAKMNLPINKFIAQLRGKNGRCTIPVIKAVGEKAEITKLALINEYKFNSFMDFKYLKPYGIITNNLSDGSIIFDYKGNKISYRLRSCQTKVKTDIKEGKLNFTINSRLEGDINNYLFNKELFDAKEINEVRVELQKFIEEQMKKTVAYFQNDVGLDFITFEENTKKHNYKVYQKFKDNWDEEFQKASFTYDINLFIRRFGGVKK